MPAPEVFPVSGPALAMELEGLAAMLRDPHPGMLTWQQAVHRRLDIVREYMLRADAAGVVGLVEKESCTGGCTLQRI